MALRAILDKLDSVPEAQRALYVERDGKFVLDVDPESAEEAFASGLKKNRDQALKELAQAKKALKDWDGIDKDEYQQLKQARDEAERKKATAEGDFKSLEKQLVERHSAELTQRETKIGKLTKALERHLVDAELTRAIAAKKGVPELLLPYARQFVRVKEAEDGFQGYIADEAGNPRVADGKGTPMDYDAFVEQELMVRFPRAFDGTGSSGGGASKSSGGAAGATRTIAADPKEFLANIDGIAKGTTRVAMPE